MEYEQMEYEQIDMWGEKASPADKEYWQGEMKRLVPENIRIRKLTPRECYRLMAFDDQSFNRTEKVNSNSQLYKQAGNSICVNVLEAIFGQMFEGKENEWERWLSTRGYEKDGRKG